jgi:hypothetical protein
MSTAGESSNPQKENAQRQRPTEEEHIPGGLKPARDDK